MYYGYDGKSGIFDEVMKDFFENDRAFQKNTRIAELTELVARNEDELVSCLDNDEKDIFHKYQAVQGELDEFCECEIFIKGFRLGMQLTVEGMKNNITETK